MIPTWVMVAALAAGASEPVPVIPQSPDEVPTYRAPSALFHIPCKTDALPPEVVGVELWYSINAGRTWSKSSDIRRDQNQFVFLARQSGEYLFAVRFCYKSGAASRPKEDLVPEMRVVVKSGTDSTRKRPTAIDAANDLDDELTRVELELIRKELKRLSEMSELTPAAEDKLDRLRIRLRDLRDRLNRDSGPSANSGLTSPPTTSRAPSLLPRAIPPHAADDLIPATNLPVAPLPRAPGRP